MLTQEEQIYQGWMDECLCAGASALERKEYFFEKATKLLEESGDLPDSISRCSWVVRRSSGQEIHYLDGFSLSEESHRNSVTDDLQSPNVLRLFYCDFVSSLNIRALTKETFERSWNNLKSIYNQIALGKITSLNEAHPLVELARAIRTQLTVALRNQSKPEIRLILLTNQSNKHKIPAREESENVIFVYDVWDIGRLMGTETHDVVVDFSKYGGIPCLKADLGENVDIYDSYLAVFPGEAIAECYEAYREKLLEQNVRVYLQNKGKVNKGMRDTLLHNPFVFFVYNNGLAITADNLVLNEDGTRILALHNMQVVNGGQTMASIHNTWSNDGNRLRGVSVQAKLTIVSKAIEDALVPDISRYSNTQNAVKATDLDSNANVQRWYEDQSRRIIAPDGSYWYYERVRGQYQNAQLNLTTARKKFFKEQYPALRKIDKKDLARAMMAYELYPHLVAKGGEKTFSGAEDIMGFGRMVELLWQQSEYYFSDNLYRQSIAKVILFIETNKIAAQYCSKYSTFKASLRGYMVAMLVVRLELDCRSLNLNMIWERQEVGAVIRKMLISTAEKLSEVIEESGQLHRLQEWLKTEPAWVKIKENAHHIAIEYPTQNGASPILNKNPEYLRDQLKTTVDFGKLTENQRKVFYHYPVGFWLELQEWNNSSRQFNATQCALLEKRLTGHKPPSETNCVKLLDCVKIAHMCGWKSSVEIAGSSDSVLYVQGNPIDYFLMEKSTKVLLVEAACDGSWVYPSLSQIESKYGITVDVSENAPKLGDVRVLNLNDGRRVMLCYTRKTSSSVFFMPILSACMQHVRTHVVEPDDKVVVPIMNTDNEERNEREKKQIQRLIRENLEGRTVILLEA